MNRRNPERRARSFVRAYGSPERAQWIRETPCVVCAALPSQNAHTESGGMGRKADARTIAPLCAACHTELHQSGRRTFERVHDINLSTVARFIARQWDTE